MRKTIVVLLVAVLVSCLCACSKGKTPSSDTSTKITSEMSRYVGKWVKSPYTNPNTGIVYDHAVIFYEDGTGMHSTTSSEGYSYSQYGTWSIEEDKIVLSKTHATGDFAELDIHYDENGEFIGNDIEVGGYRAFYPLAEDGTIEGYTKEY